MKKTVCFKKITSALFLLTLMVMTTCRAGMASDNQAVPGRNSTNEEIADQAANGTAVDVVEGLHRLLIRSMKMGSSSSCKERYELLARYIEDSFDFPFICRIVLGRRHWNEMDRETRKRFIEAFSEMTISTYARRFDSYSGERFQTVSAGSDKRGHFVVDAVLIKANKDEIDFRYVCRKTGGKWKIVSVSAKGVNDLSVKRADYNSFLRKHSVEELIARLHGQAERCLGKGGSR